LSALNLLMHFTGWLSFFLLVNYRLPIRPQTKRTYYEYTGLWHIYAILSMNAWFWSSIFHTRCALLKASLCCHNTLYLAEHPYSFVGILT
jgi:hypothetical protein